MIARTTFLCALITLAVLGPWDLRNDLFAQESPPRILPNEDDDEGNRPSITSIAYLNDEEIRLSSAGNEITEFSYVDRKFDLYSVDLERVFCFAVSPDGRLIAIGGGRPAIEGEIVVWSRVDNKAIQRMKGHTDVVNQVAWTPDGNSLVSASADNTLRVWNMDTFEPTRTLTGHSDSVLCVAVSPDGSLVCSGSVDNTIRVWNTDTWELRRTLNNHLGTVHSLDFQPDAKQPTLASAGEDATVRIWYPTIGRLVRIIRHPTPALCVRYTPDGSTLITGSKEGQLHKVVGNGSMTPMQLNRTDTWIVSIAASDDQVFVGTVDGQLIAIGLDNE